MSGCNSLLVALKHIYAVGLPTEHGLCEEVAGLVADSGRNLFRQLMQEWPENVSPDSCFPICKSYESAIEYHNSIDSVYDSDTGEFLGIDEDFSLWDMEHNVTMTRNEYKAARLRLLIFCIEELESESSK